MSKNTSRLLWADLIRVIAILMVILIHITAPVIFRFESYSFLEWNFANILNSISRISIALFLMISGTFILSKKESLQKFLHTRLRRILIPWFAWGSIAFLYNNDFSLTQIFSVNLVKNLAETFLGGFWFMPLILGLYLITPVIKPFVMSASKSEWKYLFILWFLSVPVILHLNLLFRISDSMQLPIWIEYLGYYVFGYYVTQKLKISQSTVSIMGKIALASILFIFFTTWYQTKPNGGFYSPPYEYTGFFVTIYSFSAFIWFWKSFQKKSIQKKLMKHQKFITSLSLHSFGIFLSHALLLEILAKGIVGLKISTLSFSPFISIPLLFFIVTFSSYTLIKLLNSKLPNIFT